MLGEDDFFLLDDEDGACVGSSASSSSPSPSARLRRGFPSSTSSSLLPSEDATAWLNRRREQIARASRKVRAKRKAEISQLQEENDQLRSERAIFLKKIEDLQLKVAAMRDSGGQVDAHVENELLRAQLEEHKRFLSSCFKLSHGLPSSKHALQNLQTKASSFAETYVHSLLNKSRQEDWEKVKLPLGHFKHIRPEYELSCCYKFEEEPRSLSLRLEWAFKGVGIDGVMAAHWNGWTNYDSAKRNYNIGYDFELKPVLLPETDEHFGVWCYRETNSPGKPEWVYAVRRKRDKFVKSTLSMPASKTPGLARGVIPGEKTADSKHRSKKRRKKSSLTPLGTFGESKGWLLARTSTEHQPVDAVPGCHRVLSMIVDGCVIWESGIIKEDEDLEANFLDGPDQLVEKEMCVRVAQVVKVPARPGFGILETYNDLVTEDGTFSASFARGIDELYKACFIGTPMHDIMQ